MKKIIKFTFISIWFLSILIFFIISYIFYWMNQNTKLKLQQVLTYKNITFWLYLQPATIWEWPTNYILKFVDKEPIEEIDLWNTKLLLDNVILEYFRDDYIFERATIDIKNNKYLLFENKDIYYWIYDISKENWIVINEGIITGWNNYNFQKTIPAFDWKWNIHTNIIEILNTIKIK